MKWAHLLCAMWIPEVSLGNTTFQEPVQDVEKVPKTRWKLVSILGILSIKTVH
jgi:NuA3 HAT complex component NTO1